MAGGRVTLFVRDGEPHLRARGMVASTRCVCSERHSRGSHMVHPLLPLEVTTPENKSIRSTQSSNMQESPPQKRLLVMCSSPFMRLAQHITALRAWCYCGSVWSVKPRRAPSRHCRDARVYDRVNTIMHGMSTPHPRPHGLPYCLPVTHWCSIMGWLPTPSHSSEPATAITSTTSTTSTSTTTELLLLLLLLQLQLLFFVCLVLLFTLLFI